MALPPETLPELILTPRERAWDVLDWIDAHPKQWDQRKWGYWKREGALRKRTYLCGCFATITCLRAGLTVYDTHAVDLTEAPELAHLRSMAMDDPGRLLHVARAAEGLYRVRTEQMNRLTWGGNTRTDLICAVQDIFGDAATV